MTVRPNAYTFARRKPQTQRTRGDGGKFVSRDGQAKSEEGAELQIAEPRPNYSFARRP